jgi:ABC-2 type transport system permease protein
MIAAVIGKELTVLRRDGRVLALIGLIGALALVALLTAWAAHESHEEQVRRAQSDDGEAFAQQENKSSHSAAHFGRMAYKSPAPLAVFDPGAAPYLGQVIWLEAHRQDPAMFRPAEDAPELARLADLSVAGVLIALLPLLMFVMGYSAFAGERERGTLRQIMTAGAGHDAVFIGKLMAIAGIGVGLAFAVIAISTATAVIVSDDARAVDTIIRGTAVFVGFAAYACACAGIALVVSARARTSTSALLVLLTIWAASIVIAPRVAAGAGELLHPTPDAGAFWTQASDSIAANRPKRGSSELKLIEQQVIAGAGAAGADLNRAALGQEISEVLGARVYAEAYRSLYDTYERQRESRRKASIVSPAIALMHWSSALSGTDIAAHRHFALEAEQQRQIIIRRINEDMMVNGAGQGYDYLPSAEFWSAVPDFSYRPPQAGFATRFALADLMVLLAWSGAAITAAWYAARRLTP